MPEYPIRQAQAVLPAGELLRPGGLRHGLMRPFEYTIVHSEVW